jgi:RNA polymerase sigma-70 factor, ECF subfamily
MGIAPILMDAAYTILYTGDSAIRHFFVRLFPGAACQMALMNEYAGSAMVQTKGTCAASDQDHEEFWVAASQRGDTRAFNRLVLKWEKTVFNVALRMLQNHDEAAEATQEVFLLAFRSIRRFRSDSKFSTWIYRISLNHCLTRVKQRPPGIHLSLEDASDHSNPPHQMRISETQVGELMRLEQRKRVQAALLQLPYDQQAVIELKFFQELTFEEIAAILEVPLSTIKSRLYSGLEMLKSRLGTEA